MRGIVGDAVGGEQAVVEGHALPSHKIRAKPGAGDSLFHAADDLVVERVTVKGAVNELRLAAGGTGKLHTAPVEGLGLRRAVREEAALFELDACLASLDEPVLVGAAQFDTLEAVPVGVGRRGCDVEDSCCRSRVRAVIGSGNRSGGKNVAENLQLALDFRKEMGII